MNIAERLSQLMHSKEISRSQLSKEANIPYTTIDGILKHGSDVKLSTLIKLADYFEISIDYLVGRGSEAEYNLDDLQQIELFKSFLQFQKKGGI